MKEIFRFTAGEKSLDYLATLQESGKYCVSWDLDGHIVSVYYPAETVIKLIKDGSWILNLGSDVFTTLDFIKLLTERNPTVTVNIKSGIYIVRHNMDNYFAETDEEIRSVLTSIDSLENFNAKNY